MLPMADCLALNKLDYSAMPWCQYRQLWRGYIYARMRWEAQKEASDE